MAKSLESRFPSAESVAQWITEEGFNAEVGESFIDQGMDGEAIVSAFGVTCGPDCLKDVVKRYGDRLKIYRKLKTLIEQEQISDEDINIGMPTCSTRQDDVQECGSIRSVSLSTPPVTPSLRSVENVLKSNPGSSKSPGSSCSIRSNTFSLKGAGKIKDSSSIPDPFIIPAFRHATEENLSERILEDGDRKYMVQTVATVLMTYKQKPSLAECGKVARAMISKYPFLADSDSTGEHSWKWFIYNRIHNVNKPRSRSKSKAGLPVPQSKKMKLTQDKHHYPVEIPECADDEESNSRNLSLLKDEVAKSKPSVLSLKELMKRTFTQRRILLTRAETPMLVKEILADYPPLTKSTFVALELGLITGRSEIRDEFESNFLAWSNAIVLYCKKTQVRSTALQLVSSEYDEDDPTFSDKKVLIAIRCMQLLFTQAKTKRTDGDIPFIMKFVPKGTPANNAADPDNNQPHIVAFVDDMDDEEITQCFICVEQQLMMEAPSLLVAIFNFIAAHYIFNLSYHSKIHDLSVFIQEKILKIESDGKLKKIPPLVSSHISGIVRMYKSTCETEI